MAKCRSLTWQRIQHGDIMTNTTLQRKCAKSDKENSMAKCDCIIYGKHCNRFSMTDASRQKVNLTHGKKDNMEKTSARKIHHNTKTWQLQHDKEKGRNMNLSQSREYAKCSSYSGTHCVLDVQILFRHVRRFSQKDSFLKGFFLF